MARPEGFEPPTLRSVVCRTQLHQTYEIGNKSNRIRPFYLICELGPTCEYAQKTCVYAAIRLHFVYMNDAQTVRLTQKAAESARLPASGQAFIRDSEITGFALRVTTKGARSWIWEGRIGGRVRRVTLGRFPDVPCILARERALKIRGAIARGEDPADERAARRHEAILDDLESAWFERHAIPHKAPRSVKGDRDLLKYIPSAWRARRLSTFNRSEIEALHARIGQEHGQYAANHLIRLLRAMFNKGRDWAMLMSDNPAARIKLFREDARDRFLSANEMARVNQALIEESDWRWRAYFPLLLMLGTRRSELLSARWEDFDFEALTWRIPETKAGHPHLLPLPRAVAELLAGLPSRAEGGWLFPGTGATGHIAEPKKAWQRIRARACVADVRIHDLRHTLASWLVAQAHGLTLIGRALNHSQTSTTQRYAHVALDPIREALERNTALMIGEKR